MKRRIDTAIARSRWLGTPLFVGAVLLLAANDHVLKGRFPNWWTGKLSDFAGLAMAGVVLSVVLGSRRGLPVAGASFVLLKLVPGFAEALAPVLGGITRRDATDLIALAVLPPLRLTLRSWEVGVRAPANNTVPPQHLGRGAAVRSMAAVVALVFATAATTATSCSPEPAVVEVTAEGRGLYARVSNAFDTPRWARSNDGGDTWQLSGPPVDTSPDTRTEPPTANEDPYEDPGATGTQTACVDDGTCWRLRDRRAIERIMPNGEMAEEFKLTEDEFTNINTGCVGGSVGVLSSIAVTEVNGTPRPVASLGAAGVLVRHDGKWETASVLNVPPRSASRLESAGPAAVLLFCPVLAGSIWLIGRKRWASWRAGVIVAALGAVSTLMARVLFQLLAETTTDGTRIAGRISIAGMIATTLLALVAARWFPPRRREREAPLIPPPPPGASG